MPITNTLLFVRRRKDSFANQLTSQLYATASIDVQYFNCGSPYRSLANKFWTMPLKMILPVVHSWVEKRLYQIRLRIMSGRKISFTIVAWKAYPGQIIRYCRAIESS